MADRFSAYFWTFSHVVGAVVMAAGWRRYRQRFFLWMAIGWALQTFGGITREMLSIDLQVVVRVALRVTSTSTGFVSFYYALAYVRRSDFATVVGVSGDTIRVRHGMQNYDLRVGEVEDPNPGDRITPVLDSSGELVRLPRG